MTQFNRANFTKDGPYCMYNGKFVARFKRGGRADFISFLVKNFTVEEYFELMANPLATPMGILETKGYVHPNIRKFLVSKGLPQTMEAFNEYQRRQYAPKITPSLANTDLAKSPYFELGLPTNKSELVRAAAERLGYQVIDIGLVDVDQERACQMVINLRMDVV